MKLTANNVSIGTTIAGLPIVGGWYLDHVHWIGLPVDLKEPLLALAVSLIVVALIANAVAHWPRNQATDQQTAWQGGTTPPNPNEFQDIDAFYRTYDNRMFTEAETFIRSQSDKYEPGTKREGFLVRFVATVSTILIFERVWLSIFQSQLKVLHKLNSRIRTFEELRGDYAEAVKLYPQIHEKRPFEIWLGYMKTMLLIREYSPTEAEITIRGVEFLKYLVEMHYDESLRFG